MFFAQIWWRGGGWSKENQWGRAMRKETETMSRLGYAKEGGKKGEMWHHSISWEWGREALGG